jgi:hypothetical protein
MPSLLGSVETTSIEEDKSRIEESHPTFLSISYHAYQIFNLNT